MVPAVGEEPVRDRICDATLVCVARWGVTKTTLEDVARQAGCGRATIYRAFRGGKAEVLHAVVRREITRFRRTVEAALAGETGLEDKVVAGVVAAAGFLEGHDALRYLVRHEPDVILPWVAFNRMGALYAVVAGFAAPHLERELGDAEDAARAAEWLARVVLTYVAQPVPGVDLADPVAARHLVSTYVLPGLLSGTAATKEPS
jgi:AcrR family transcriptional regulator